MLTYVLCTLVLRIHSRSSLAVVADIDMSTYVLCTLVLRIHSRSSLAVVADIDMSTYVHLYFVFTAGLH